MKIKKYLYDCFIISIFFLGIYLTTNYLAHLNILPHYKMYFDWELSIPLFSYFIYFYLSFYLLFLIPYFLIPENNFKILKNKLIYGTIFSGVIFLIFPGDLGFTRVVPQESLLYENIFNIDYPHNLFPSLHVTYSLILSYSCAKNKNNLIKVLFFIWFLLICLSTVLVHQHHIFDVFSAILFSLTLIFLTRKDSYEQK